MTALGLSAMAIGLMMVIVGTLLAYRDETSRLHRADPLRGSTDEFTTALARLLEALADHPIGIRLVALGMLMFFLGGTVAGVGSVTN